MAEPRTITVAGGGNFGTVIANIIAMRGHRVMLWMRDAEQVADVRERRENTRYLPGHRLHDGVEPTADLGAAVADSMLVFVAVPSASVREVASDIGRHLQPGTGVISTTKGIEVQGFMLMSEVISEVCPGAPVGVLSGPNIAEEIAAGDFTGTVVASPDAGLRALVQDVVHSRSFRVYANPDMFGVELGGALKNMYAIAAGMAKALGAGQNTVSMLVTRALGEMSRFAAALGASPMTFLGLAGVGDLLVTCTSPLSRNYQLGLALGGGLDLEAAQASVGKLAEGVNTIAAVHARAGELGVTMPIVQGLHEILFESRQLPEVLVRLMLAEQRDDVEFVTAALDQPR